MEQHHEEKMEIKSIRLQLVEDKRRQNKLMVQLVAANEAVKRSPTALNEAVGMSATAENNIEVCEDMLVLDYLHDKRADKSLMQDRTTLLYYLGGAGGILDLLGMPSD